MKKNFFKKLSFVLALAMIVSVIQPAAGVFAKAKSPALNAPSKTLLLGVEGRSEYDFNVKNPVAGSKYTWASSDKAVVTVKANGLATAKAAGKAKVTCVIKLKSGKKVTLSAPVVVKDNVKEISSIEVKDTADVAKLKIATDYTLTAKYVTMSGASESKSAYIGWSVDSAKATIKDGVFNATEAGKYKVTAVAFQSKAKYDAWVASKAAVSADIPSKTLDVTVVNTMKVAQKDLDSFTATFDSAMTDVSKNISLFKVVGTTETAITNIKTVTMSTDNKTATVDLYVPFTEGATYVVKYTNVDAANFTAATVKPENVTGMSITTTEATINEGKVLEVALTDANGVNIANADLLNRVEFAVKSDKAVYFDAGTKMIYFYTKGDTATVTATYHTYKFDAGKEVGNLTATGTVTGVDKATLVAGTVKAWTLVKSDGSEAPDYSKVKQLLAVKDSKRLCAQLNTTTGTKVDTLSSYTDSKVTFESSDSTICMIDNLGYLYPLKAGEVTIVVKYDTKPVDTIKLTVNGERKAAYMELSASDLVLSNVPAAVDTAKVTVKVKDQLGEEIALANGDVLVTSTTIAPANSNAGAMIASVSGADITFAGSNAVKGSYQFKIVAKDQTRYVAITVVNSQLSAASYNVELSTRDADSKVTTDVQSPSVTIKLFGLAEGVKVSALDSISGGEFEVRVTDPDNKTTVLDNATAFNLTNLSVSGVAVKVKAGQYKVTAYHKVSGNYVPVDYDYFTVKDTQSNPVLAEVKEETYTGNDLDAIVMHCFKLTFNGAELTSNITMGEHSGNVASKLYVKDVIYTEQIGGVYVQHTVLIDKVVTAK